MNQALLIAAIAATAFGVRALMESRAASEEAAAAAGSGSAIGLSQAFLRERDALKPAALAAVAVGGLVLLKRA